MTRYLEFASAKHGKRLHSYRDLYDWSVERIPDFWDTMWEFAGIRTSRPYEQVVDDLAKFPGARWFVGARLNFAENLLRYRDDRVALITRDETTGSPVDDVCRALRNGRTTGAIPSRHGRRAG